MSPWLPTRDDRDDHDDDEEDEDEEEVVVRATLAARFPMNGRALCLMTPAMFRYRVPHRGAGDLLHADFQRRLLSALLVSH